MEKYQIAFFDIDGTLVDSRKMTGSMIDAVPTSTKKAIIELKRKGIVPVIATGRHREAVIEFADALGIDSLVVSNGQEVIYKGRSIYQNTIEQSIIEKVFIEFQKREIQVFYDTVEGIFMLPTEKESIDRGMIVQQLQPNEVPRNVLQIMCNSAEQASIKKWLTELKVVRAAPMALDILPYGGSKASGIDRLLTELEIPIEASLAFGDEENDLEMFQAVGFPIAMGNATKIIKDHASFVTKEVWNDGISFACKELKLVK